MRPARPGAGSSVRWRAERCILCPQDLGRRCRRDCPHRTFRDMDSGRFVRAPWSRALCSWRQQRVGFSTARAPPAARCRPARRRQMRGEPAHRHPRERGTDEAEGRVRARDAVGGWVWLAGRVRNRSRRAIVVDDNWSFASEANHAPAPLAGGRPYMKRRTMTPPITSPSLKSCRGESGWPLWHATHASTFATSA